MCDDFGSDMDFSGDVSGDIGTDSDLSGDVSCDIGTDSDLSCESSDIDFEAEGIFDVPQDDIQSDISEGSGEDVYEADSLDEIEILEESGDIHTVAERMEELYGENPAADLTPAQEGLREFEENSSERLEEIQNQKDALKELKSSLLAGDQKALEMFGLETPDTSEEEGHQKVLTR